jgi:hypothetical protein
MDQGKRRDVSLSLPPTMKFRHPSHFFIRCATGSHLSKIVLGSLKLKEDCASQQGVRYRREGSRILLPHMNDPGTSSLLLFRRQRFGIYPGTSK